jgi:hypothetical protein
MDVAVPLAVKVVLILLGARAFGPLVPFWVAAATRSGQGGYFVWQAPIFAACEFDRKSNHSATLLRYIQGPAIRFSS